MKYFLHDTNAFQDEKVAELFIAHGYEGLGLFYSILEKLAYQEKPVKTAVLKRQLSVGKKLEKCWLFLESLQLISSNNGETFNDNLLKFSEKYQVSKEKNRERVAQWREKQALTETVTHYEHVRNAPKVKIIKDKIGTSKEVPTADAGVLGSEKKIEPLQPQSPPVEAPHTGGAADVPTRKARTPKAGQLIITGPLAALLSPAGEAARVQSMTKPLTQVEADALVSQYGQPAAAEILKEMANYAKLTNSISANLTARKWLDKRTTPPTHANAPFGHSQGATGSRYNTSAKGTFGGFASRSGSPATQPLGGADPNKFPGQVPPVTG